ncbi:heat shock protein hsp20, putative [Babesia ovis]|uniref:Heat shock protein hsp20, putative n=1 Tax=Babesia ovis TaxID=5869 RepID=A0A9W5WVZ0_BABOV|nr:heat shock protein hsp20, putative [Babesia ovis]
MTEWDDRGHWNVPIERGSRQRNFVMPPPLRLYNPSKIVGVNKGYTVPKYTFWNPISPASVLKAAYDSILTRPIGNHSDSKTVRDRRCPFDYQSNAFGKYVDGFHKWVFGDGPTEEGVFGDFMDLGRQMISHAWDGLHRAHRSYRPWYDNDLFDEFNRDLSHDVHNYRIAEERGRHRSSGSRMHCPLDKAPGGSNDSGHAQPTPYNGHKLDGIRHTQYSGMGIADTDDDRYYTMTFRLPNVNEENIRIKIYNGVLTVSSNVNSVQHGPDESTMQYSERFHHSVTLPSDAAERQAKAMFRNGTLTIKIPKGYDRTDMRDNL